MKGASKWQGGGWAKDSDKIPSIAWLGMAGVAALFIALLYIGAWAGF